MARGCQSGAYVTSKSLIVNGTGARCWPVDEMRHPSPARATVISTLPIGVVPAKIVNDAVPSAGVAGVWPAEAIVAESRRAAARDVRSRVRGMESGYQEARNGAAYDIR